MAFMLRVKANCADDEIVAKMEAALKTFYSLQEEHNGVITYHFCRPEPETKPLYYEYTEIYANETAFFGHSSDMKFIKAYCSVWPTDKMKSTTYGYGPMTEKVKKICDDFLKCHYPQDTAGPILASRGFNRESSLGGDGPVLLVGEIIAKDGKAEEIMASITKLSSQVNDGVVVCFANIPEKETAPNAIDLLEVCTTNSHLISHFGSDSAKSILKSVHDNSTLVKFRAYGTLLSEAVKVIEEAGAEVVSREMVTGYVLHPNADPDGQ